MTMRQRLKTSRTSLLIAAAAVTVIAGSSLTGALADPAAEVIHACAKKGNGQLRVVDSLNPCRRTTSTR